MKKIKIPVEVSARHIHLNQKDSDKLFGKNHEFKKIKDLSQLGEFAAEETVTIKTKKNQINKVRVLGPLRDYSQVEISATDAYSLGINPPVRMSGKLDGAERIFIIGPKGSIDKKEVVILANRHIHMSKDEAKKYKIRNCQKVKVQIHGERGAVLDNVRVKIKDTYRLDMHIDLDEANAVGLRAGGNGSGWIVR